MSITCKEYGLFSLPPSDSNWTFCPISVLSLKIDNLPHPPVDVGLASPLTITWTGPPLVVIDVEITVAGKEAPLSIVTLLPLFWL